jgi:tRNA (guanine6-N2)-methyltransferase
MNTLLLRTAPGLEDLVRKEALSSLRTAYPSSSPVKGRSGRGWVEIVPPLDADPAVLVRELHTVFRGMEVKARTTRGDTEAAAAAADCARAGGFRELRHRDAFRITCYAPQEPSGTVRAVEQRVGEAAVSASGAPVDLTGGTVNYGVEFCDGRIWYGLLLKDEEETPRYRKLFQVRSSLKPHIAAAMLDLVGFRTRPGTVLDPCCGSGTILMEAASLHPGGRFYGCDIDQRCAEGAQKNLNALSRADRGSRIYEGDARALGDLFSSGSIDYLVTNPPFGIRTGKQLNFFAFYRDLLKGAGRVLNPGGRIALLVGRKRGIFNRAAEEDGTFKIHHVRVIDASGLFPALYILRRKG